MFVVYLFSFQRSAALTDALRRSPSVECFDSIETPIAGVNKKMSLFSTFFIEHLFDIEKPLFLPVYCLFLYINRKGGSFI